MSGCNNEAVVHTPIMAAATDTACLPGVAGVPSHEGPGGFADAEPDRYFYDDEQTYAEYEFDVNADGTVTFGISYVKGDDIVTMLDVLERALAIQRPA